jgi:hypothetical protein
VKFEERKNLLNLQNLRANFFTQIEQIKQIKIHDNPRFALAILVIRVQIITTKNHQNEKASHTIINDTFFNCDYGSE